MSNSTSSGFIIAAVFVIYQLSNPVRAQPSDFEVDVHISECLQLPCEITIINTFALDDATYRYIMISDATAIKKLFMDERQTPGGHREVIVRDASVTNVSLQLSPPGSNLSSVCNITLLVTCAGSFEYSLRVKGWVPEWVRAGFNDVITPPSTSEYSLRAEEWVPEWVRAGFNDVITSPSIVSGPVFDIGLDRNDTDPLLFNGSAITRQVTATYSNAREKPGTVSLTLPTVLSARILDMTSNHSQHENCTWYGVITSSVTFFTSGLFDIVFEVVIGEDVYRRVLEVLVQKDRGTPSEDTYPTGLLPWLPLIVAGSIIVCLLVIGARRRAKYNECKRELVARYVNESTTLDSKPFNPQKISEFSAVL